LEQWISSRTKPRSDAGFFVVDSLRRTASAIRKKANAGLPSIRREGGEMAKMGSSNRERNTVQRQANGAMSARGSQDTIALLLQGRRRLKNEELGLIGLDGVEEGVEVGGAGGGKLREQEVEFALSGDEVALGGIFGFERSVF